ncbi:MAG: hypothetical protein ACC682_09745 [Gemmatimonadota bacterium]
MFQVLLAVGLFWVIASVQFGGLIDAENGSGIQQLLGVVLTLGLFLGVFYGLRAVVGGLPQFLSFGLPIAIPLTLVGWLARVGFKLVGVKIVRAKFSDATH